MLEEKETKTRLHVLDRRFIIEGAENERSD